MTSGQQPNVFEQSAGNKEVVGQKWALITANGNNFSTFDGFLATLEARQADVVCGQEAHLAETAAREN